MVLTIYTRVDGKKRGEVPTGNDAPRTLSGEEFASLAGGAVGHVAHQGVSEDGGKVTWQRRLVRECLERQSVQVGRADRFLITFFGYNISTTCARPSLSLLAPQLSQIILLFASIPKSCVIGAGAGAIKSPEGFVWEAGDTMRGLCGNEFPSDMNCSSMKRLKVWILET